jgi:hypothetical protein
MKESSNDNPLKLYLYLSSVQNSKFDSAQQNKDYLNRAITFSQETLNYLSALILKEINEDWDQNAKKLINELSESVIYLFFIHSLL